MGILKYDPGVLNCTCQLNFPEEDVFRALGLLDVIFKMNEYLKYKPGILYFSFQPKFPEEVVF